MGMPTTSLIVNLLQKLVFKARSICRCGVLMGMPTTSSIVVVIHNLCVQPIALFVAVVQNWLTHDLSIWSTLQTDQSSCEVRTRCFTIIIRHVVIISHMNVNVRSSGVNLIDKYK